jgi:hypothetical protein
MMDNQIQGRLTLNSINNVSSARKIQMKIDKNRANNYINY